MTLNNYDIRVVVVIAVVAVVVVCEVVADDVAVVSGRCPVHVYNTFLVSCHDGNSFPRQQTSHHAYRNEKSNAIL